MTLYGRTIDAYHIGRLLGRGSFGDVYEAKCQHSGQLVAIKMISKELLHNQGLLDRITREVEIHCQLQHPHIVELYEYFEDDRRVYLVMELCKNGELLALLRKHGRFDAGTARSFFSQLVDGVAYLHGHSILHRDLKLSNLLLSADNTLKIADFGLAAAIGANDPERRTICGTPNYMCPEIVEQQPYSLGADLWSLGVTLYTLLTGTPPFQSAAVRGTLQRVGCADYLLPRQLPAEAADLISQLLQKNPAQRLSLPAIQSHPFLVGPQRGQAIPPENESDHVPQATRSGTALPRSNLAPESLHTVEQRERAERIYEGDRVEKRGSGRSKRSERSEGDLNRSETSGGVERSGIWDGQRHPRNEAPAQSHSREHRSEGRRERQGERSENTASAGRMEVTRFSDPGLERTEGVRVDHGSASSGLRERAAEAERLWSRASGAQRNEAPEGTVPRTDVRTERRTDRGTEQNASESRGSDARPQSRSSRPGTASSEPGGPRASSQVTNRTPPGATQLPTRPLSTQRLKALRHETSYGSLAILEDGRVQVHNTGPGGSILTVSPDGLEVEVEQAGRPHKTYRFPALPDALLMHYAHAAAFVGLVASATPKVIYIFERGQATCMENGDLQVCFTDSSPATLLQVDAASGKVTVNPPNGGPVMLPSLHSRPTDFQASPSDTCQPSPDDTWLWEVLSQARRCQRKSAEAEARALARHPPKTFPLVARSARLKTVSQRGGADATVALAAAAPPAEVERAAELVAAVQGLHTSLLPANVSVASAQELSFASSSEASSHLQPGPRFQSQSQHAPAPVLRRALPHSPSSPLSPSPSLPETPSTRDGSSLERVAERQPFAARGRPTPLEHVAELDDRERRPSGLRHASLGESPALEDRRDDLVTEAVERRHGGLERASDDVRRHVAAERRVGRDLPTGEAPGRRSAGVEDASAPQGAERPPRPKRNGSEEPRNAAVPVERGEERAERSAGRPAASDVMRRRKDEPARVLADVSNRPPAEAQTARRVEKAKGEQRGSGLLDGVRRRADRMGAVGPIGGSLKSGETERRKLPVIGESFKVFEDRGEIQPRSRLPEAKVQHSETVRHMLSQEEYAGESEGKKLSGSYKDPVLNRRTNHPRGERLGQAQAPLDPPSARSFSDTWQDLSAANREPSDFPPAGPSSDTWQHLSGARRTFPAASPSSDTWHDGRSEDPVFEGLSVPVELRKAERPSAREDARSYVASNRLVAANQGSSVTANRGSSSAPPGPSSSHSSPPSLPESPLPLSQNTRDFLSRPSASDMARQGDPPQLDGTAGRPRKGPNGANGRQSTWEILSRPPELDTAKPGDPPELDAAGNPGRERFSGRPEKGLDGASGRQSAYFPGVGWAIRLKSGELLMHYLDDCQMVVSNDGASVEFWPPGAKMGGSKYTLSDRTSIPQEVRDKLQYLSAFIKLIRKQSHGTQTYSKWVTPRTSPALTAQ